MLNVPLNTKEDISGTLYPDNILASSEKQLKTRRSKIQNLGSHNN